MALAALLAASCAKESGQKETAPLPQVPISVEASVSGLTKAVTDGLQTTFEANDQLTLYAWTGSNTAVPEKKVVAGVVNTYDGTKWTPASTMLWKNVSDAHYFLGISPARTVNNFTADPVTSSVDLLVATVLGDGIVAPQTVTAPPVALEFSHVMAWLKVNVKYRNQWGGVPEAVVTATAAPAGTIDYLTKTITPGTVTAQTLTAAATAAEGYDATYSSLCIPQAVRTFAFVIAGQTLSYTHSEDIALEAGKITTLTLIVGKDKIALENNTVSAWEAGEVNPGMGDASGLLVDATRPLTIKAKENGTTVTFTDRRSSGKVTWITSDGRSGTINLMNNTVSLAAGQRVWFIGDGTNNAFGTGAESTSSRIALNKDCEVYGNIMSLLGPDFATATTLPGNNTFAYLFSGQTHLKNSAEEGLYMPATTLTAGCYRGLFKGCTGLGRVVVNATDISASNCLTDWVNGIAGAGFGLVTPNPKQWKMGDNLPWGATVYTQGESALEEVYTTPTALATNLTYNGSAQNLINAGTAHKDGVVLEYSTNGTSWSTTVPKGTNAGDYNVYCRVKDGGVTSAALAKTIAKAAPTYTAPTKKSNLTYNGGSQALVNAGSATGGTMQYKLGSGSWSTSVPSQTNAGSYTVSWKVVGDANHTDVNETSLGSISIAKKAPTFNLSTTSVSFANTEKVNATKEVTITYDGDGTLSVSSSNTGKVTASVNQSTKKITLTRKDGGAASGITITVSAAAGTNYSAPANKTVSVSMAATDGHLLKDAAVGYAVADNGLAYADKNNIPDGAKIIGMVAYKNGNNGLIMEKDWAGSKAYYKDEINQPAADNSSHAFGSAKLCTTSTSKTTLYWFVGTKANYESCGLTNQAGFTSVNTKRLNAGCEDLNSGRTYGTSDGWEFYGGTSTFWYNYWSNGSHTITLLISF